MTKTTGLSSGLSISIFYQISQTSSHRMANGRRSPIFKSSGTLEVILLFARTVLPVKSSALSPPPLQKNPNLKPLKGSLNPQPPILTWQMSLLPIALERKLPEVRPYPLALPPPKQERDDSETRKEISTPPSSARTRSKRLFPLTEIYTLTTES